MAMPTLAILAASLALAGCVDQLLPNPQLSAKSIQSRTASALHQPASAVIVADRRYDGTAHSSYTAWTPRGTYRCVIDDGSTRALKLTDPPHCSPQ